MRASTKDELMMALVQVLWLGASASLFAVWVRMLCRMLLGTAQRARAGALARGAGWPCLTEQWHELRHAALARTLCTARLRLICLAAALVAMTLIGLMIWPPGPG